MSIPSRPSALPARRRVGVVTTLAALLVSLSCALPAAAFDVLDFSGKLADPTGNPLLQAGAHPDVTTTVSFARVPDENGNDSPDGNARDIQVDLPPGLIGDPSAAPKCTQSELLGDGFASACSPASQVGLAKITTYFFGGFEIPEPLYNMEPPPGVPGQFGINIAGVLVFINAEVRSGGDYGITANVEKISQTLAMGDTTLTLWGVPADPVHDPERYGKGGFEAGVPSTEPRRPLMTNPTGCSSTPLTTRLRTDSWEDPGVFLTASFDQDSEGNPLTIQGCEHVPFDPSISVQPASRAAGEPTGLDVKVGLPQSDNPDGLATANLEGTVLTLPEGMTVSPSSAGGLGACAPAEIGLASDADPTCPSSSKLGTVTIETPLLDDPMTGSIFLAKQGDNPFGNLLSIYLVARGRGVVIKLPGRIDPDPSTGRLTTTFENAPQLPFSEMTLRFKGGPRAALSNPTSCGEKTVEAQMRSWSGKTVTRTDSFTISGDGAGAACAPLGFAPDFVAGTTNPLAGEDSPFALRFARGDHEQQLADISVDLPQGLLGDVGSVPLCPDAQAAAGACGSASRIGSVETAAGPGEMPFSLPGRAYLTGPYKGGPYGLSIVVPAVAGPFDLGTVVVRAAIHVDPDTAALRIVSDPLPRILQGIPLQIRTVRVDVDRPAFMRNPTSCAPKLIDARLTSIGGAAHATGSRFQVSDCAALSFKPRLGIRLAGKRGQMRSGGHPALRAAVTQGKGQANIVKAKVTLPRNVVLDSANSADPKLLCGYDAALKADCPRSTVIGKASLSTPILDRKLAGPVHLVQGIKFGKDGNRIRSLPTLLVKLRGEVAINLRSKTAVDSKDRLVSTFPKVPDAPMSKFSLQINGGSKGILVVTETRRGRINLCNAKQTALIALDGHNGRSADYPTRVKTPCKIKKRKR